MGIFRDYKEVPEMFGAILTNSPGFICTGFAYLIDDTWMFEFKNTLTNQCVYTA